MCYSFINAVTGAGLQLDKKSSGVKAPAQVWSCCLCHPLTLCCPGVMNPSSGVITLQNSLSTGQFLYLKNFMSLPQCESSGRHRRICLGFFLKGLGLWGSSVLCFTWGIVMATAANSDFPQFCGLGHAAGPSAGFIQSSFCSFVACYQICFITKVSWAWGFCVC